MRAADHIVDMGPAAGIHIPVEHVVIDGVQEAVARAAAAHLPVFP